MSIVFYCEEFNDCDLDNGKTPLRKKFNEIIKDLEENNSTSQGNIKLIKGDGNIEYFRAKLSDGDRLLFTRRKHNDKDAFVILEVILNHDYHKSKFLTNREKIRNIKIIGEEVSDIVEIEDAPQVSYLGKFITFSAKQKDIVKRVGKFELPLVISGSAGSGKTSVALESLKRIKEKLEGGRILYITKSKNLIKESKKLLEYEYYNETADEFKIAVPGEIDFLSLHEFLEKRAEDIKGKKPIDRSKFFSWFNKICKKDGFKEYKKDGDKIFEEFTAVIGGGGLLEEDQYTQLGDRQAIFPKEKRGNIYGLFEEYKKFIEKDSEYYDPNLIAHKCTEEKIYDAIVVDEVQDLTESTLGLILKSLKDKSKGNFLLCGDVNQVIHPSFFSLSRLKSSLSDKCEKKLKLCNLEKNYRNSKQVIELANRILHFKNYCFAPEDKITKDEGKAFFMKSDTKNTGNVSFIADDKKEEVAKKIFKSINWAVLALDDESKESARQLFNTPLVFNIHEAKGLEFKNVVLYKFTSCKAYNEIWNIVCPDKSEGEIDNTINRIRDSYNEREVNASRNKNKKDKSLEKYKFYMNALYVGVTRAAVNLYIIDDKSNLLKIIEPGEAGNINIEQEESSSEEWRNKALELIDEGNIEQAELIARKLQNEGKKEYSEKIIDVLNNHKCNKEETEKYTKEIVDALKVKRYHTQEYLDKDKQVISELKIDTEGSISFQSYQKCSMGEFSASAEKAKRLQGTKYKAKQNLNQEKKPKELKKDEEMLHSALKSKDLERVKSLIKKGINIDTKDENGYTCLGTAAGFNHKSLAKFLLQNGANVNTEDYDGYTPLHMAAREGYSDMARLLLGWKANVNAKDKKGGTPLHLAVENGYLDVACLLLGKKAGVNTEDYDGYTPLHFAVVKGFSDMVKLLIQHGADVNANDKEGFTPLDKAIIYDKDSIVTLFLDSKKDNINSRNNFNFTPLHMAVMHGKDNTVKLLLEHEANVNAKDQKGFTPLHIAVVDDKDSIVDLLLADPNINVGCIDLKLITGKSASKKKLVQKRLQDNELFNMIKQAAEIDENKVDELLKKIEKLLLESKNKHGFKPSLNYSLDGNDENTTIKIAIKAGGKVLQLLYDYAEKNIGTDTEIFKQLKHAKENSQPKRDLCDVSVFKHSTPDQGFLFSNG